MNELVKKFWGRPQQRSLSSYVARALIPRAVLFGAMACALLVGQAMSVDPLASTAGYQPAVRPTWTSADGTANPGCISARAWHAGDVAKSVVAYRSGATRSVQLPFDTAWRLNHDATEVNDVWVVGLCK